MENCDDGSRLTIEVYYPFESGFKTHMEYRVREYTGTNWNMVLGAGQYNTAESHDSFKFLRRSGSETFTGGTVKVWGKQS